MIDLGIISIRSFRTTVAIHIRMRGMSKPVRMMRDVTGKDITVENCYRKAQWIFLPYGNSWKEEIPNK